MISNSRAAGFTFVSYSHKNGEFVSRLIKSLNDLGIATWRDIDDIPKGEAWKDEIRRAVQNCLCVIIVLSPPAVQSKYIAQELAFAEAYHKEVFPVLHEECNIPDELRSIQYFDFQKDDRFYYALRLLVEKLCRDVLPDGAEILVSLDQKPVFIVSEHLRRLVDFEYNIQTWLMNLLQSKPLSMAVDEAASIQLAEYASDSSITNRQIVDDAARVIAYSGAPLALECLVEKLRQGPKASRRRALDSLALIRRERGYLPSELPKSIRRRIFLHACIRQLTDQPSALLIRYLFATIGVALGIVITLYQGFHDPDGRFFLSRISNALSNGVLYGVLAGVGILLASELAPRLTLLNRRSRLLLALAGGWLFSALTFVLINKLFYTRTPRDWWPVIALSLVFVTGFALGRLLPGSSLHRILLRVALAFLGVFIALYLPCWQSMRIALLYFDPATCLPLTLLISATVSLIAFTPELTDRVMARESAPVRQRIIVVLKSFLRRE